MQVIVCLKQILDPEMPSGSFHLDPKRKRAIPPPGTPPVLSPFDENALEAALRLKDGQGAKVIAVSLGDKLARAVVKKPLSAGADELVLLEDPDWEDLDHFASARILAAAIRKIGEFDLILTGRQAADWDAGLVGSALAEELGLGCVTLARKIEIIKDKVRVERVAPDGYEVVEALRPCVITVDSDLGELRQITMPGIFAAKKKPIREWKPADLELSSPAPARCELVDLYLPKRETVCEIIGGESPEEAALKLADKLFDKCPA